MRHYLYITIFALLLVGTNCDVFDTLTGNESSDTPIIVDQPVELYPVLLDGDWGYINKEGAMVIEPEHQIAYPFSDGLAAVRSGWRWYFLDERGEFVIDGSFEDIRPFSEGKAAVRVDGRWGYINTSGNL